ncbi:MAG TPA: hypothetical protein VFC00_30960 [Micromonosporaceae bacterium]|nr:hypothetical protein [Micromonosporaceae bacterium]
MARSRTLKPEFWTDEVIVELSFAARLFYQGCWNFSICDQGHIDDSPKSLKMKIFPADDVDPAALIDELIKWGRLRRKETPDGRTYLHVGTLVKHTRMETRWKTRCPYCALEGLAKPVSAPPATDEHAEPRAGFDEHDGAHENPDDIKERKGREGKESEPRKRGTRLPEDSGATLGTFPAAVPDGQSESLESPATEGLGSPGTQNASRPGGAPKSSGAKGTRIPETFSITNEMRAWANEHVPGLNIEIETVKFVNHFTAKTGRGSTMLRWDLAWQNWMLRSVDFGGARASPPVVAHTPGHTLFNPDDHD